MIILSLSMVKYLLRILIEKTAFLNNLCNAINWQTKPTYSFGLARTKKIKLKVLN